MAPVFAQTLRAALPRTSTSRRWVFVPYDQLGDDHGPLHRIPPGELGIVLVESPWKARLRPYHRQKLALVLANLRHFAIEQARRGVAVRHLIADGPYRDALRPIAAELGTLQVMEPAERELRVDLQPLVDEGMIDVVEHEGWLSTDRDFDPAGRGPPWRMDDFYRRLRKRTGLLMDDVGEPMGGKLSFDTENRRSWKGDPPAPTAPRFRPDPITEEVGDLVARVFADHPGRLDLTALPATERDAEQLWRWALQECLPWFGPYEDAMSNVARGLFHTRVSPLLNLGRLSAWRVVRDVRDSDAPLASREGFIRQVLGWREFVRHVHRATDGFRDRGRPATHPGDGGFSRWQGRRFLASDPSGVADGGGAPNGLGARTPLPIAYWGVPSGLRCLDEVVRGVWEDGWSHHITRLMVLSNIASLLDVTPRELTDWFWVAYVDAYDWVVEPNVLAMGTFATLGTMTTKPYVSGAAYIDKMSDYCKACSFSPKRNCPITRLYWAYLARHRDTLAGNPRLRMPMRSLERRSSTDRAEDAATFERVTRRLANGDALQPDDDAALPGASSHRVGNTRSRKSTTSSR